MSLGQKGKRRGKEKENQRNLVQEEEPFLRCPLLKVGPQTADVEMLKLPLHWCKPSERCVDLWLKVPACQVCKLEARLCRVVGISHVKFVCGWHVLGYFR